VGWRRTDSRQKARKRQFRGKKVANRRLRGGVCARCKQQAARCKQHSASREPQIASLKSRASSNKPQATGRKTHFGCVFMCETTPLICFNRPFAAPLGVYFRMKTSPFSPRKVEASRVSTVNWKAQGSNEKVRRMGG
jgi:hypothetical protein